MITSSIPVWGQTKSSGSAGDRVDGAAIHGRLLDPAGGAVRGARVTARGRQGAESTAVTDEEGAYSFSDLPPGEYRISAVAAAFQPAERTVKLEGGRLEVEIRLAVRGVDEFVTVTTGDTAYRAESATTAMRADLALRDTPQSIQIVTKQVIEEQGATEINDVVRNVSGVSVPNSSGGRAQDFTIRGFTSSRNTYKDGFRNDFNSNRAGHEMSNVERVEVLKGPASVLYGRLDPSGVVNLVTKRPLAEHYRSLTIYGGKFNLFRPQLDLSGPLNRSQRLLYRLNLAYETHDTFRDFNQRERVFAAPSLTWTVTEKTTFSFDAEVMRGSSLIDRGLIALGSGVAPIPLRTYLGDPAIPYKYQQGRSGAQVYHVFNPQWSLRSAFRLALNKANYHSRQPRRLLADNRTLELSHDYSDQSLQTYYWQNDVSTRMRTGRIKHDLVYGFDLGRERFASNSLSGPTRTIDIYRPVYNFARGLIELRGNSITTNDAAGLYGQDLITLRRDLKFLVGGRFDYYHQTNDNRFARTVQQAIDRAFTPRVGVVYQPVEPVSIYASYSRSFQPQLQQTYDFQPFKPETGQQYETGVKLDLLDRRLTATVAVYQITKQNVTTPDIRPGIPSGYSLQLGEQRSRGFEADLSAQPARRWNLLFSYGFTDAVVSRDNTRAGAIPIVGNFLLGVPRHTGSLWTSYEFDRRFIRGLGLGAGLFGVGRRFGDNEHTFTVPGYGRVDATVFYKIYRKDRVKYRLALNLGNLLDKPYYEGVRGRYGIVPGAPLTGVVSMQVTF
ncbi:MAG TPA: TonB-dependent receptor [Blastocatellia bacterium]|nr:TonB-dependent receptor [Blastocatellia bacterium]